MKNNRFSLKMAFGMIQIVYLLLFFFNCFRYYYNSTQNYWFAHDYLNPVAIILALTALAVYWEYYKKDFRYFAVFFLWSLFTTILRFLIFGDNSDFSYHYQLLTAVFVALPLCLAFPKKSTLKALKVLMQICVVFLCIAGLIALILVLCRVVLLNPFDNEQVVGLVYITSAYRLSMWANPNLVGMIYLVALWLSCYLTVFSRRKLTKIFYGFCSLILWLVLLLSDSRTCIYAFVISFSLYLCYLYFHSSFKSYLRNRGVTCLLLFFVLCFSLIVINKLAIFTCTQLSEVISRFIDTENLPSVLLQSQPARKIAQDRPISTLTQGRLMIWLNTVKTIIRYPYILLIGTSVSEVANVIRVYSPYLYPHLHNSWLHVLTAYGIPGLVTVIAATAKFLKTMIRQLFVFFDRLPKEIKMMPFIVLAILLTSLLESSIFNLSNIIYFENTWLFILIGYCAIYPKLS